MPHRTETAPACERAADPDIFYSTVKRKVTEAKEICGGCELRASCLEFAMTFPDEDQWGVWGGIDAAGRRALRASDPARWPVQTPEIAGYLPGRGEIYGRSAKKHDPVDWGQVERDELDDRVVSLMDRYGSETEVGYGLTDESGKVLYVNNEVAA